MTLVIFPSRRRLRENAAPSSMRPVHMCYTRSTCLASSSCKRTLKKSMGSNAFSAFICNRFLVSFQLNTLSHHGAIECTMTEPSALWILVNILCMFFGWMTIDHTIIQMLSCPSTHWKETWLEAAAFSIGTMFSAMGLRALLRLSGEKKSDGLRFAEGCSERAGLQRKVVM